jgi:hypothetical protein
LNWIQTAKPDLGFISQSSFNFSNQYLKSRKKDRIESQPEKFHQTIHEYFQILGGPNPPKEIINQWFCPVKLISLPSIPEHSPEQVSDFIQKEINRWNSNI